MRLTIRGLHATKSLLIIFACVALLTGCATQKPLSTAHKQSIKHIAIDVSDIEYTHSPSLVFIYGWGDFLGGALYSALKDKTPQEVIYSYLEKDGTLAATVANGFVYQFEKSGLFQLAGKETADAYMVITFPMIQFVEYEGKFKLCGRMDAKLKNHEGEVIWEDFEVFSAFNDSLIGYTLTEFINDKDKIQEALNAFSQASAREFVYSLGGTPVAINYKLQNSSPQ